MDQDIEKDESLLRKRPFTAVRYIEHNWVRERAPEFIALPESDQDDKPFIDQIKVRGIVGGISIA